jgi:hypothetical protein
LVPPELEVLLVLVPVLVPVLATPPSPLLVVPGPVVFELQAAIANEAAQAVAKTILLSFMARSYHGPFAREKRTGVTPRPSSRSTIGWASSGRKGRYCCTDDSVFAMSRATCRIA